MATTKKNWYVVCTSGKNEKKVMALLRNKGFNTYIPSSPFATLSRSDKKFMGQSILPGYIFIEAEKPAELDLGPASRFANLMYWLDKPAMISSDEIQALKEFVTNHENLEVEKIAITAYNGSNADNRYNPGIPLLLKTRMHNKQAISLHLTSVGYCIKATADEGVQTQFQRTTSKAS